MILARKCGSRQTERLEQQAENSHLEMQALDGKSTLGTASDSETSKPTLVTYFLQQGHIS